MNESASASHKQRISICRRQEQITASGNFSSWQAITIIIISCGTLVKPLNIITLICNLCSFFHFPFLNLLLRKKDCQMCGFWTHWPWLHCPEWLTLALPSWPWSERNPKGRKPWLIHTATTSRHPESIQTCYTKKRKWTSLYNNHLLQNQWRGIKTTILSFA